MGSSKALDGSYSPYPNHLIKVLNIMSQATVIKPVVEQQTCSTCPHFNNYYEPIGYADSTAEGRRNAPAFGKGWCKLFDQQAREHHEITNDCVISLDSIISHELQDNLGLFPDINFEELKAFPTEEVIEEADLPYSEYQVGSIVKVIDADEPHTEWAIFEVY